MYSYLVPPLISWQCVQITRIWVERGFTKRNIDRLDTFLLGHVCLQVASHMTEWSPMSWPLCINSPMMRPISCHVDLAVTAVTQRPVGKQTRPYALHSARYSGTSWCIRMYSPNFNRVTTTLGPSSFMHQAPMSGIKRNGTQKCHRRDCTSFETYSKREDHDSICFPASVFALAPVFCGVFDNLKWMWEEWGVDVIALLSTTYIYCWKWILDEDGDIKGTGIKAALISYPLFLETWTFYCTVPLCCLGFLRWSRAKGGRRWKQTSVVTLSSSSL